jgi:hypothetical protein
MDGDKLDEVEAIRARHEEFPAPTDPRGPLTPYGWALDDRATLLALLDAARAELAEVREAAARARHDQELQETWDAARAALAKDAPDPLGDGP